MAAQSVLVTTSAVLSALGALNIADPNIATPNTSSNTAATKMRLPNFPLPRELRDMIYEYLLDGDYTRIQRTCYEVNQQQNLDGNRTGPKAYHFHTNILAVNHAIHKEAEEVLYKRNTFVVVSYQWPSFGKERGGTYWVPIVSNEHVARMKLHSLRIHVSSGSQTQEGASAPVESYIILARDVKAFCVSMHARVWDLNGAAVTINQVPETPTYTTTEVGIAGVSLDHVVNPPSRMRCQLRDTKYRTMDRALQNDMLAPLATVIGLSQKVVFTGAICDSQQIDFLKRRMGPSLVCMHAVQWHAFEECAIAKEVADAALEHDDLELVVQYYRMIVRMLSTKLGGLTGRENKPIYMMSPPFIQMIQVIDTFHVEVLLILACGELKLGNMQRFLHAVDDADEILDFARLGRVVHAALPEGMVDRRQSVNLYRYLYEPDRTRHTEHHGTADDFCEKVFCRGEKGGPLMAHDYEILLRCPDRHNVVSAKHLPLDQCAAVSLPFTPSSFYKGVVDTVQRGQYQGWHDVGFLREFGGGWQDQIHMMQGIMGVEKTDFDKL
jgi:hypothetical protein